MNNKFTPVPLFINAKTIDTSLAMKYFNEKWANLIEWIQEQHKIHKECVSRKSLLYVHVRKIKISGKDLDI